MPLPSFSPPASPGAPATPQPPALTGSTARLLQTDTDTDADVEMSSTKALAHTFWQLAAEAASLREAAVAAAVAKTKAELSVQLSAAEGVDEGVDIEMEAAADARLAAVGVEAEGLEGRQARFWRLLQAAERRLEELEARERAGVLTLQSPPEPGAAEAAVEGAEQLSQDGTRKGSASVAMRLLLACLALGLTEPAVHLLFVVARELPGWRGAERVVVM